jgi:hypothetical protein
MEDVYLAYSEEIWESSAPYRAHLPHLQAGQCRRQENAALNLLAFSASSILDIFFHLLHHILDFHRTFVTRTLLASPAISH